MTTPRHKLQKSDGVESAKAEMISDGMQGVIMYHGMLQTLDNHRREMKGQTRDRKLAKFKHSKLGREQQLNEAACDESIGNIAQCTNNRRPRMPLPMNSFQKSAAEMADTYKKELGKRNCTIEPDNKVRL
jgi:hypothetical protein